MSLDVSAKSDPFSLRSSHGAWPDGRAARALAPYLGAVFFGGVAQRYRLAIDRQIARTYEERPNGSTRRDILDVWLEETRRGRQPRQ